MLDIGAGPGCIGEIFCKGIRSPEFSDKNKYIAMDISSKMLVRAKVAANNICAAGVQADMERPWPLAEASCGAVVSSAALQWISEGAMPVWFQEAARVLPKGGVLAVACFTKGSLAQLEALKSLAPSLVHSFPRPIALKQAADRAGFDCSLEMENYSMQYKSVRDLLHSIKGVGGRNKVASIERRYTGMVGKQWMRRLEDAYPRAKADGSGITANWQISYIWGTKG